MRNIYTTYASDTDITFILADVIAPSVGAK